MPRDTASFIFDTMAKKSRMPDLGKVATCRATKRPEESMVRLGSRADRGLVAAGSLSVHDEAVLLVGAEEEVGRSTLHAVDAGEALVDEAGHLVEIVGRDDDEEVVAAGHEEAALHLFEAGDAFGDTVEAADAFGANLNFDNRADAVLGLVTRIQYWAHAQQDALLAQGGELTVDSFGAEAEDFADLGSVEGFPIEDELEYGVHGGKSGLLDRAAGADGGGETVEDWDGLLKRDARVGDAAAVGGGVLALPILAAFDEVAFDHHAGNHV